MKRIRGVGLLIALGVGAFLASPASAESVVMTLDKPTLLNFLRAASPYSFEVAVAGFTERFTLLNPRELRFEGGRIRLKVDCRAEPIPFSAELQPTMVVYFDRARNAFVAKAESLPVDLGSLGTIQLDRYLDPVVIPSSFSNTLKDGIPGLMIDTVIRDVKVLEDRIEARADLVFRKQPTQPTASARR